MRTVSTGILSALLGAILVPMALHLGYVMQANAQQMTFAFCLLVIVACVGALVIRASNYAKEQASMRHAERECEMAVRMMEESA